MEQVMLVVSPDGDGALGILHEVLEQEPRGAFSVHSGSVVSREGGTFRVLDPMQEVGTAKVLGAGGAGAVLGALVGPLVALLGGLTGAAGGAILEGLEADDSALLLGAVAARIPEGSAGAVLHADAAASGAVEAAADARGLTVQRWSVDEVKRELAAAGVAVRVAEQEAD